MASDPKMTSWSYEIRYDDDSSAEIRVSVDTQDAPEELSIETFDAPVRIEPKHLPWLIACLRDAAEKLGVIDSEATDEQ